MADIKEEIENNAEEEAQETPSYLDAVKNYNPCGGNTDNYTNPAAAIAISTAATALIAAGMSQIATEAVTQGTILVLIGVAIYFIKAYLMKKNCL